ncbi:MAG TPA: DJ-1/PfpI family protein [Blastocatellia bacterium]|nr:DJ-1/PfpI family protein [Blastocatellia bacterium]
MKIAFVIFEGMTALDFVGIFDPVTRLKTMGFIEELSWEVCSLTEDVPDGAGLRILPTRVGGSLEAFDLVIVPGGYGTRRLARDPAFVEWLRTAERCRLKASVCTGSVLLGAAGFLKGKRATTHRTSFEDLRPFCEEVVDQRIVDEGDVISARGVSSALDLGLHLCERLAGPEVKEKIRTQMDYQCA